MYGKLSNKLEAFTSNTFRKVLSQIRKNKFLILIVLIITATFLILPEILFIAFVDRNKITSEITKFVSESHLVLSWDGISQSAYRGIVFHNVRVSIDSEAFRLKTIATIPELNVMPDYIRTLASHKFVVNTIYIKSAKWKYWVNSTELNQFFNEKIAVLLKKNNEFYVSFKNNDLSLIFEKKNYEREIWNINIKSGFIQSHNHTLKSRFDYNDVAWGKGSFAFIPDLCEQCNLNSGKVKIKVNDLPVNRLSWFFKSYKLKNGYIDGSVDGYFKKVNSIRDITTNASVKIDKLVINDETDNSIFSNDQVKMEFNYADTQNSIKSEFSGFWNKSRFSGNFQKKQNSVWPELCTFELENKGRHVFPLVYGYRIKGLKEIKLNIKEDPEKRHYRLVSGNLLVESGRIFNSEKEEVLGLPKLNVNLKDNKFHGYVKSFKGNTDLDFDFKGSLFPIMTKINTLIEFEDYKKNKPLEYDTVVFQIAEEGRFKSSNFIWSDVQPFYTYLVGKWNKSLNNDQYKGWRPSILRDRDWFQKYLMRTELKNEIQVENWASEKSFNSEKTEVQTLKGFLNYANSFLEFSLQSENLNYLLKLDASSSYPVIRGEYKFHLKYRDAFSAIWTPPDFTKHFESCEIDYSYSTSGERPVDLMSNYLGNGIIMFNNAGLDKKTGNSDDWEILTVNLKKYADKIMINMEGKNSISTLSSWGSFNENDDNLWKLKTSVYEVRSQ